MALDHVTLVRIRAGLPLGSGAAGMFNSRYGINYKPESKSFLQVLRTLLLLESNNGRGFGNQGESCRQRVEAIERLGAGESVEGEVRGGEAALPLPGDEKRSKTTGAD